MHYLVRHYFIKEFKVLDFCHLYSDVHNSISVCYCFRYKAPKSSKHVPNTIQLFLKLWSSEIASDFPKNEKVTNECDIESLCTKPAIFNETGFRRGYER